MKRRILIFAFLVIGLAGCKDKNPEFTGPGEAEEARETFVLQTEYGVYGERGNATFAMDREKHECVYNTYTRSFRIHDDGLTMQVAMQLSEEPSEDTAVELTVQRAGQDDPAEEVYSVIVVKRAEDRLWLWDQEKVCGFVILWEND